MIIEEVIKNKMKELLPAQIPVCTEMPASLKNPGEGLTFLLIEKTGSSQTNQICTSTIAFQSYGATFYEAAALNEIVKEVIHGLLDLEEITGIHFQTDYPFNNLARHQYRYQAVFSVSHY